METPELTKAQKRKEQQHRYYMKIREKKIAAAKERYAKIKKTDITYKQIPKEPTYEDLLEFRSRILASKHKSYMKRKVSKEKQEDAPAENPEVEVS